MNENLHNTESFDSELMLLPFYQKYPEYLPFIGKLYNEHKILLLGESHYFPKESWFHKIPENWYSGSNKKLTSEERLWCNTRRVVNNIHGNKIPEPQKWKKSRTIYRNIENSMIDSGFPLSDNLFCNVAFMNAFQRPAEDTGESIKVLKIDVEQSVVVINHVIEIIEPESICFLSSKAAKFFAHEITMKSDVVSHPASIWWNRKSKRGISREKFVELLREYTALRY